MKTLHLLPVNLGNAPTTVWLPSEAQETAARLKTFIAESAKSARAYLKQIGTQHIIREINIHELSPKTDPATIKQWLINCDQEEIGLVSDAGCPAVADPGAHVVAIAHQLGWQVCPWVGPSSILLGLMASGLNGQQFSFHGYTPIAPEQRHQQLKHWENLSRKLKQTQIFIETPYRNMSMLKSLLETLQPQTQLCLVCNLHTEQQWIKSMSIQAWRRFSIPNLDKQPCLFLFLA